MKQLLRPATPALFALATAGALFAQVPQIFVDTTPITFNAQQSGARPPAVIRLVSASTSVTFQATAQVTSGTAWLGVTPAQGIAGPTTASQISIEALSTSLTPGSYQGSVLITAAGASSVSIPVLLVIGAPGATGQVSPSSLAFSFPTGSTSPQVQNLNLTGTGVAQAFTATAAVPWLTLFPTSGLTPAAGQSPIIIQVLANPTGLPEGTQNANITISLAGGASQIIVPVTLTLSAGATITVNTDPLRFNYQIGGGFPAQQRSVVNVTSSGAAVSYFVASTGGSWLVASPVSGATPGTVIVDVNALGLQPGTYNGEVTVTPVGSVAAAPQRVPVVLVVSTLPLLSLANPANGLSIGSLSFAHQFGGTPPPGQSVAVASSGAQLLYSVTPVYNKGANWLVVTPIQNVTPNGFTISVSPEGLTPDTYTATLLVIASASGNPQQSIPVTLKVTNDPQLTLSAGNLNFAYQRGRLLPVPLAVTVSSSTAPQSFTAAVTTNNGGGWLVATPVSGTTPTDVRVEVSSGVLLTLAPGLYTGSVTFTSATSTALLNVALWVSDGPLITVSRQSLSFTTQQNVIPAFEAVGITSTGDPIDVGITSVVSTPAGGTWLVLSPVAGRTPLSLSVTANPSGLSPGTYRANIEVRSVTAGVTNSPQTIPVTLVISSGALNVAPTQLVFTQATGGPAPAAQPIGVTSSGTALSWTASAVMNIGANWLSHTPGAGSTPGSISVSVNGAQLAPGTYTGSVTIVSPGAVGSPRTVPVTLTVTAASTVSVSPAQLAFSAVQGGAAPATQSVTVQSTIAGQAFTAAAATASGGSWLAVTPASGSAPQNLTVSINPAGLVPGSYSGSITVTVPGAVNSPQTISVTLTVGAGATASVTPAQLSFMAVQGGTSPPTQTIAVQSTSSNLAFSASSSTTSGGTWMAVTPSSGTTPQNLTVIVNPVGLLAGNYSGTITITVPGAGNSPLSVAVTLTVAAVPVPVMASVVNAASFIAGALSPGEIVTIQGNNLGPVVGVSAQVVNGFLPTTVSDVRVLFDGIAAPILYVRADQINAIVPYQVAGLATTRIQVEHRGSASAVREVRVDNTAPGVFTDGAGQGAILNENGSYNTRANPEQKGRVVVLFATGEGNTFPAGVNGRITTETTLDTLRKPLAPVSVTIGGVRAEVVYAGAAYGLVAGALQVNAVVPAAVGSGQQQVVVTVGAATSQPGVFVSIQ